MADPQIVNRRPTQGDTDVDALTPFRFGVRDLDTRVDITSVYTLVVYGSALYDPANEEIPLNDDVLEEQDVGVYFSSFDDASGTTEPGNPCDQTIEDVGGNAVYRIEKSDGDGVAQEGVLFLTTAAQASAQPYSFKAAIDLVNVNTGTFDYTTFSGFTGVMMGLVYWPENTGLFLFFVDDGTKKVVVAGPAGDGIGTRSVSSSVVFDWSAEAYTYSILWDPTVHRRTAMVFATDSSGVETLLAEVDIDTLPEFLASVRIGSLYAEDEPTGKVTFLLGGDFPDMGDYIDIYGIEIYDFGRALVVAGAPTGSSTLSIQPTEAIFINGPEGPSEWVTVGDGTESQTATATVLTSEDGGDYYYREEPDLSSGEWLVMGRLAAKNAVHPGEYTTGMGVSVADGTRAFRLTFLDDFSRNFLGIEEEDAVDDDIVDGYLVPDGDIDWEEAFYFTMLGSASRDAFRLYVDSDTAVGVDHTYTAAGYPAASTPAVSVGFIDSGSFSGDFYLLHLWVLPNCTHYEPVDATYPETQGWTRVNHASASRALEDDELEVTCSATGQYDIYYITDATYDATSGAAVVFRFQLSDWTDGDGAVNPMRTEIGPVAAVRTTTVAAQVYFTKNTDGKAYVYLPHESSDLSDVLSQNAAGRAISAEIDESEAHVYFLQVKPYQYIRLYLDHDTTPVIEVPWASASTSLRALPTNMPASAVVAVGSLGEEAGVKGTFSFFRSSVGKGYDLTTGLDVSEADLQASVYGAAADLLVDVQDED